MIGLTGLPRIDPGEAALRQALLQALNGLHVGGVTWRAAVPERAPCDLCWFVCGCGSRFAPELWNGERPRFLPRDAVVAAEWLERAEAVICAIEAALGLELEPADLARESPPADLLAVRLDGLVAGAVRQRLHLAVPRANRLLVEPAPFAPELVGQVAVEIDLTVEGPRLAPHEAADLARGDLLLLGRGPLRATLHTGWGVPVAGLFHPASRTFRSISDDRSTR